VTPESVVAVVETTEVSQEFLVIAEIPTTGDDSVPAIVETCSTEEVVVTSKEEPINTTTADAEESKTESDAPN